MAGTNGVVMSDLKFTPTEQRILNVLSDGMRHHRDEVRDAIDQFAEYNTIKVHLHNIRKKLRPRGQDIIFEAHRWGVYYRHVRLLHDSSRE